MSKKHHFQTLSGSDIKRATVRHYQEKNTMSAGRSFALWQTFSMGMICGGFLLGFWHDFPVTMAVLGSLIVLVFTLLVGLKLTIYAMDSFKPFEFYKPKTYLDDDKLPVYTVIVALYQEKNSFPILLKNLLALDYPRDKLEFLFMLEADDKDTIHTVVSHILPHNNINISVLTLPHSLPRTKPKALNAAIPFMNGEYCVVYDAEDRPDIHQLRMAASSFAELPDDVVALQARLTFYNRNRSLMTKMFTIEYDIWFHHFLPGLMRLGLPLPLAGTSTHIRTRDVYDIGGWDAYNVTEDCDLGMRFYRMDLKTLILDSDTFEEAPIYLNMWIKQRTRWLKGYMQTLFVHTGRLFTDMSELGFFKFLGLWLVIGGQILSAFLHPIAIGCFIYQLVASDFLLKELFVLELKPLMIFLLIAGILIPPMQAEIIYRRMKKSKILWHTAFFHPIYWGFAAYASYRAVLQLIYAPSYWEKTTHGLDLDDETQEWDTEQANDIIHDTKTDE